jgi:hypothetical protein
MSHVTDLIICASLLDEDKEPAMQKWFDEHRNHEQGPKRVDQHAGGGKCVQATVYMGAHNYITDEEILQMVLQIEWDQPLALRIYVQHEHGAHFVPLGTEEDP